jgi:hypothetical protein
MADQIKTAGTGAEGEDTSGSANPLSGDFGSGTGTSSQPETGGQFSGTSGQPLDTGASAVEGQQTQTQSKKAPASSGMFTNIQKYVSKNKPQAQKMGQAVKQDVETKAGDIRSVVEGAQNKLADDISRAETARTGAETFASKQIGAITSGMGFGTPVQTDQQGNRNLTASTPQAPSLTPDEETAKRYQELLGGQISGYVDPQAQDLSQQILEAKQLAQKTQQAGTEQGRQNLLKDIFRKEGQYTRGMSGLDQLIMAGDPSAMQQIADVQGIGQQLISGRPDDPSTPDIDESMVGIPQIGSNLSAQAATELDMKQKALDAIKAQYGKTVSGLEDPIQARLKEAQDFQRTIGAEFGEGADLVIDPKVAEALKLQEMITYGIDPTSYYKGELAAPSSAAQVMTQGELAKLQALQELSGKASDLSGFDEVGGYDPSKAFDLESFQAAVDAKKEELRVDDQDLFQQASTGLQQQQDIDRQILDTVKKRTGKSYRSVEEMQNDPFLNMDYLAGSNFNDLINQRQGIQDNIKNLSMQLYGGGPGFARNLDLDTINQALQNIKDAQTKKLTIG